MYAALQSTLDSLKVQASSHHYTKLVLDRFEDVKTRVIVARDVAVTEVAKRREMAEEIVARRREAAIAMVKSYQELVLDIIDDKREAVQIQVAVLKEKATQVSQTARDTVTSRVRSVVERVDEAKRTKLTSSIHQAFTTAVVATAIVVVFAMTWMLRLNFLLRESLPPKAVTAVDHQVDKVKPHAVKALNIATSVDARLGGYGAAAVGIVQAEVAKRVEAPPAEEQEVAH